MALLARFAKFVAARRALPACRSARAPIVLGAWRRYRSTGGNNNENGGRRFELPAYHLRSRRSLDGRHAQPAGKTQCLYRADGGGDRGCVRARRYRRRRPRRHRHRRGPGILRRRRRVGRRQQFRYVGKPWRRRLRPSTRRTQRPLRRGDLQLPQTLDLRAINGAGGRRRHHHDPADGHSDCGQGRQRSASSSPAAASSPEAGSAWFLPKLVGLPQSLRWCLSGRTFDAEEARQGGLVSEVVDPADLLHRAKAIAHEMTAETSAVSIATHPPDAVALCRRAGSVRAA